MTIRHTHRPRRRTALAGLLLVAAPVLAACGSDDTEAAAQASAVSVDDAWAKATDQGMTSAFGTLRNDSAEDVVVVAASSEASSSVEIHEMAAGADGAMVMRKKEGGLTVRAGGTHELAPGGDHLMLMQLVDPLDPGTDVTVTLTFADDSTMTFTAPVRSFSGANETYAGGDLHSDSGLEGGAPAHE